MMMLLLVFSIAPAAIAEENTTEDNSLENTNIEVTNLEDVESTDNNLTDLNNVTIETISIENNETDQEIPEDDSVDEETENELRAMDGLRGREMRLLQLEKSISVSILKAQSIVDAVNELNISSQELELILNELSEIKNEVVSANISSEDSVQNFVDLKKDARELVQNFRKTVHEVIPKEDLKELKLMVEKVDKSELKELRDRIKEKRDEYNANKLSHFFGKLGLEKKELIQGIKEGKLNLKEARQEIKSRMGEMTKEEKRQAFSDIKKERVKAKLDVKSKFNKLKENIKERKQERKDRRVEKLDKDGKRGLKSKQVRNSKSVKPTKKVKSNVNDKRAISKSKTSDVKSNNRGGKNK